MAHHRLGHKAESNQWLDKFRRYKVPDLWTANDPWNDLELLLFSRKVETIRREEGENTK